MSEPADILSRVLIVLLSLAPLPARALEASAVNPDDRAILAWLSATPAEPRDDQAKPPDRWRQPPKDHPDWSGARRDVAYFLMHQFAAIAVLYVAPESVSGWSEEQKRNYSFRQWRDNVAKPVWDEDVWWINYVLHPYWGAAYYTRAREQGLDRAQSFWFSALLSTLFEYGAEALAEPVSKQDLVLTPVFGALLGEYLFAPLRARIRDQPGQLDWSDKALLVLTDPLGAINEETDRLLGTGTSIRLWHPGVPASHEHPPPGQRYTHTPAHAGLPAAKPAWGIQLSIDW